MRKYVSREMLMVMLKQKDEEVVERRRALIEEREQMLIENDLKMDKVNDRIWEVERLREQCAAMIKQTTKDKCKIRELQQILNKYRQENDHGKGRTAEVSLEDADS